MIQSVSPLIDKLSMIGLNSYNVFNSNYLSYEDLNRLPYNSIVLINSKSYDGIKTYMNMLGIVKQELWGVKLFTPEGYLYIYEKDVKGLNIEYVSSPSFIQLRPAFYSYGENLDLMFELLKGINVENYEGLKFMNMIKDILVNNEIRNYIS